MPLSSKHAESSDTAISNVRLRFHSVDLLIIDEYALMGKYTFWRIDYNLRKAFGTDKPFGGKHVILLGDPH